MRTPLGAYRVVIKAEIGEIGAGALLQGSRHTRTPVCTNMVESKANAGDIGGAAGLPQCPSQGCTPLRVDVIIIEDEVGEVATDVSLQGPR